MDATTMEEPNGFAAVCKHFTDKQDAVIRRAQEIFQKYELKTKTSAGPPEFKFGHPNHGSYHVVVPVEAKDLARYLFKVPLDGATGKWDKASEKALRTEAETMKSLYSTIPVPYVYDYSETTDNPIGCPFIVISEIVGLPLYDVWFGHQLHPDKITREETKVHRIRALEGIAEAMVKLGMFTAAEAGAPEYNKKGELIGAGATRIIDEMAMIDSAQAVDDEDSPTSSTDAGEPAYDTTEARDLENKLAGGASWELHEIASMVPPTLIGSAPQSDTSPDASVVESDTDEDKVEVAIYAECFPVSTPDKYYTRPLDLRPQEHRYSEAVESFLRLLISCIPEPVCGERNAEDQFVLAHPDFNIQNFIVKSDGTLVGIIDWDGVETVPHSVGNLALPGWLTRDWDPIRYVYEPNMGDEAAIVGGYQPESLWEDSEENLADFRGIYADLIERYTILGSADSADSVERGYTAARTCRLSLVTENLAIASYDSVCRANILEKIVSKMWDAHGRRDSNPGMWDEDSGLGLDDEENDFDRNLYPSFYGIAQMYFEGDGVVAAPVESHIREGFLALLERLAGH